VKEEEGREGRVSMDSTKFRKRLTPLATVKLNALLLHVIASIGIQPGERFEEDAR